MSTWRTCGGLSRAHVQAHDGADALRVLAGETVDLIYLDMRFDRIDRSRLLGDHPAATHESGGDPGRAWRYLQNNQGLFILDAIRQAGHGHIPVILSYDFSREEKRFSRLKQVHPSLHWVRDAVTPGEIRSLMHQVVPG